MSAWKDWEHISKLAPDRWKKQNEIEIQVEEKNNPETSDENEDLTVKKSADFKTSESYMDKAYCADILSERFYEIDPLVCPKCGSEMKILSVIMDSCEIKKILRTGCPQHLVKTNKAPPGIDEKVLVDE
jgi:hypothetical protein